jgi:hypothetical protein
VSSSLLKKVLWVCLFAVAFAFVESSVVVYLRAIYYPDGFTFPLRLIADEHLVVELLREFSTVIMLVAIGLVAGRRGWERFAYFMIAFGIWDIFYYVWLKALLDWPSSFAEWDVLFLIPLVWIGPVLAPVLISLMMIVCGLLILQRLEAGRTFRPGFRSWALSIIATVLLLYSFMGDTGATLEGKDPQAYGYGLLAVGLVLYGLAFFFACVPSPPPEK